jgi:Na+/glutamate symporter
MPYGFHKAIAYVSLTTTCGLIGSIAGPAGIIVGIASGAALAKVSMKRNLREKETRKKEVEERKAKQARMRQKQKKEKRKVRGTFINSQ